VSSLALAKEGPLSTEAFFDHRSSSEGGGEGGLFAGANIISILQIINMIFSFQYFFYIADY